MTVSYQYEVASSTSGGFTRLLLMWRGSLYKLIYRELLLFLASFVILSLLYRNAFTADQRRLFEQVVVYCDTFISLIPLSFVLGFYVAYVAGRWWQQYMAIPWPDKSMHCIALYVNGNDTHGRMVRRTLMRYLNLTLILVLRSISSAVKRRFPTLEHVVESGFMTTVELGMYQSVPSAEFNTYWIPCTWFISLLKESRKNARITDAQGLKIIMEEFNEFRSKCGLLWSYDWVSIPLVYTQVVTIATYSFFLAALIGRQYVDSLKKPFQMEIDKFIPVFTILQFFFFMGLLKVAEQLINPFGDDDEDFELNWLIDRHTKVSYLGVDTLMMRSPPLVKDMYFDESDLTLPYTEAAVAYKKKTYRGSVHNMEVPEEKHTMFLPEIIEEDEKTTTPKSSMINLQQMAGAVEMDTAAPAAGTWRSQQPSTLSLVAESDEPKVEKGVPISSQHQTSLTYSDSLLSKKPSSMANIKTWPSVSTLQPAQSDLSFQDCEANTSSYREKQSFGSQFYPNRKLRKDSDVSLLEGLRYNVGSGIVGFSHQAKLLQQKHLDSSVQSLGKSGESLVQNPRESKSKYLSTSRENLDQTYKKNRNISWPKIVATSIQHKPPSSPGKKKGVRWKTVLDDNLDKRKTVDVVQALSQILDADEDYLDQQGKPNFGNSREDHIPVYCDMCKKKLPPSEKVEIDLASGKLNTNLKQLLIYRPITYKFKTRSCPNLCRNESDLLQSADCDADLNQPKHEKYHQLKTVVRQHPTSIFKCSLGNSKSLPAIKLISLPIRDNSPGLMEISNALVPSIVSTEIDLKPIETLTACSIETIPKLQEPDTSLAPTDVEDSPWEPADWSTLLTSRTPSLDFSTSLALHGSNSDGLNDSDNCNETLQEVVVNLDRLEPDFNREWQLS